TFFLAIDRHGLWANIRVIDPANAIWRVMMLHSDGEQTPESIDRPALIHPAVAPPVAAAGLGAPERARLRPVAYTYSKLRGLPAGDAVHQLSPTGALGMNTGIADVVDLGWKRAAAVEGWAGPKLLASYSHERQPIGMRNITKTAEFHLSHTSFGKGFDAIDDDSDEGRILREDLGPIL